MKRNHRAVSRTPLADEYFTPRTVITSIHNALPETGTLRRDTIEARHEVKGERLKLRTRNRVTIPHRAIPRANDRTPRDTMRVKLRLETRGLIDTRNATQFGTFLTSTPRERLVKPRKKHATVKPASEAERKQYETAERKQLRRKAAATRRRKAKLERETNATFTAKPVPLVFANPCIETIHFAAFAAESVTN